MKKPQPRGVPQPIFRVGKNRVPTGAEKKDALPCKNGTQIKPCYGFFQFFFGTLPAYFGTQKLTEKKRRKLGSGPKGTEKKNRKKTKNRIFTEKTEAVQIFISSLSSSTVALACLNPRWTGERSRKMAQTRTITKTSS